MSSDQRDIRFGKIAVKKGYITNGELKECLRRRKELAEQEDHEGPAPSLKKILVGTGYLSTAEAEEIEEIQEDVVQTNNIPGYEIHEKLREGATGAVYRATQLSMDRSVAIKMIFPSVIDDEEYIERFRREARTVAELDHECIVKGYDVGQEDDVNYIVMEYVDGPTLQEIIEDEGRISEEWAVKIGVQMARALAYAAENGLVHRNVKPKYIVIDQYGTAKLNDLGLTKKEGTTDGSVTQTGFTIGTPDYISPEQARGEELDVRSDIYGLGATLYHAVTGRVPFEGKAPASVITKHLTVDPEPPEDLEPSISPEFWGVIEKMMEKEPDDRYWPDELIEDFERLQEEKDPVHAHMHVKQARSRSATPESQDSPFQMTISPTFLRMVIPSAILLLVLAGLIIYAALFSDTSVPTPKNTKKSSDAGGPAGSDVAPPDDDQGDPEGREGDRESYKSLKEQVNGFNGSLEKVRALNNRITGLLEKTTNQRLQRKLRTLREKFLERQAKQYYEERIPEPVSPDENLKQSVASYRKLTEFPALYEDTSSGRRVQEHRTSIKQAIRDRLAKMKENLRRQLSNQSFSEAEKTFQTLKTIHSMNGGPELIRNWSAIRKEYLREKSRWEQRKQAQSEDSEPTDQTASDQPSTDRFSGKVEQGPGKGTVQITYDFSDRSQLADWKPITPSRTKITYDQQEEAIRFDGNGLLFHDVELTGPVHLRARVEMNEQIRNFGGIVLWTEEGGYRGMVNWAPSGIASDNPDLGTATLQRFQIPWKNGRLNLAKIRTENLSPLTPMKFPDNTTGDIGIRYGDGTLKLTLNEQELTSVQDDKFTRGRCGLIFEDVRGRIREITVSGNTEGNSLENDPERSEK